MSVVFYHVYIIGEQVRYPFGGYFASFSEPGKFGVNLFFVLSGFIILFAHYKDIEQPTRIKTYAWRRLTKIYPMYWICSALYVVVALAGIGQPDFTSDIRSILSAVTLINFTEVPIVPLRVAWTLFYEMKFYIIFSAILINRRFGIAVFSLWASYIAVSYFTGITDPLRLWTLWNVHFFLGGFIFLIRNKLPNAVGAPTLVLGIVGIIYCAIHVDFDLEPIEGRNNDLLLIIAASSAMIILGSLKLEPMFQKWAPSVLKYIGDASYSLYLVHSGIISAGYIILRKFGLFGWVGEGVVYFGMAALATVGGCITHSFIEKPVLNWIRARSDARKTGRVAAVS